MLLSISCLSQNPKDAPDRVDEVVTDVVDDGTDKKADEGASDTDDSHGLLPPEDDGGDGGDVGAETGGTPSNAGAGAIRPRPGGCGPDAMKFEGECTDKDHVTKILDLRERAALDKYQNAKKPEQAAEAAHDLLEQQVAQIDKTEDDLDEILELLREEDRKRDVKKKEGQL